MAMKLPVADMGLENEQVLIETFQWCFLEDVVNSAATI